MSGTKEALRDEVAALAETIRELRDELASQRMASALHHCHGCHCSHVVISQPYVYPSVPYVYPGGYYHSPVVTCGGSANVGGGMGTVTYSSIAS